MKRRLALKAVMNLLVNVPPDEAVEAATEFAMKIDPDKDEACLCFDVCEYQVMDARSGRR